MDKPDDEQPEPDAKTPEQIAEEIRQYKLDLASRPTINGVPITDEP